MTYLLLKIKERKKKYKNAAKRWIWSGRVKEAEMPAICWGFDLYWAWPRNFYHDYQENYQRIKVKVILHLNLKSGCIELIIVNLNDSAKNIEEDVATIKKLTAKNGVGNQESKSVTSVKSANLKNFPAFNYTFYFQ